MQYNGNFQLLTIINGNVVDKNIFTINSTNQATTDWTPFSPKTKENDQKKPVDIQQVLCIPCPLNTRQ